MLNLILFSVFSKSNFPPPPDYFYLNEFVTPTEYTWKQDICTTLLSYFPLVLQFSGLYKDVGMRKEYIWKLENFKKEPGFCLLFLFLSVVVQIHTKEMIQNFK